MVRSSFLNAFRYQTRQFVQQLKSAVEEQKLCRSDEMCCRAPWTVLRRFLEFPRVLLDLGASRWWTFSGLREILSAESEYSSSSPRDARGERRERDVRSGRHKR